MRLSRDPRFERENGLEAAEKKQPVASAPSAAAGVGVPSSPLRLGRDPGRRREDHLRRDHDLDRVAPGDDGELRAAAAAAAAGSSWP